MDNTQGFFLTGNFDCHQRCIKQPDCTSATFNYRSESEALCFLQNVPINYTQNLEGDWEAIKIKGESDELNCLMS